MATDDGAPDYRDPTIAVERRVEDLLGRMTLPEKAGQLVGTWAGDHGERQDLDDVAAAVRDHHVGAAAPFGWGGAIAVALDDVLAAGRRLQRVATEETRLGIPLLLNVDAVHGNAYVAGATVFPHGLGAAATWDPALLERAARVTATEVARVGAHQNYSPTVDVGREPRWGRVFETFGESPRLAADVAAAKVRGYQGAGPGAEDTVLATAKHVPAYSEPERGEDAAPVEVSAYKLHNTHLPPARAAVESGVASVMASYASIEGEPAHASRRLLTGLLRDDLGFEGHVVSDWDGVRHLHEDHRVAADRREAVRLSREAGLDVASVGGVAHAGWLVDLVESGELPEAALDASVARVLGAKFRLGLFEDPFVDAERARETLGSDDHQALAREVAAASMTLLSNDGTLPLPDDADLLAAGPNADDLVHQVGGWSVYDAEHVAGTTVRAALEARAGGAVSHVLGSTLTEERDVEAAVEAAADADVAVLVLGEGWYIHEFGPRSRSGGATGEWPTRSDLRLPRAQRELARAVHGTGTPVVAVLVTGRPLVVPWLADHAAAVLMAYYPGTMGGPAVADVLYGDVDPAGRLPISVPRAHGDLPQLHDRHPHPTPIGRDEHPLAYDPLFPFGHGLSYAEFEYRGVEVGGASLPPDGVVDLRVRLANVGDRPGTEVVQAYGRQETPSRVRPVRSLVGYERVELGPGEETTVELSTPVEAFGYHVPGEGHVVEADTYHVTVAGETASFDVAGGDR